MNRYYMEVLVRANDVDGYVSPDTLAERPLKININARSELEARWKALHQCYFNGLLVSRFLSIRVRSLS